MVKHQRCGEMVAILLWLELWMSLVRLYNVCARPYAAQAV